MLKHFVFTFILGIFTLSYGTIYAGLDQHGRLDEVICVYRFENTNDSGPRNFHGTLDGAELVMGGKYEKGLKLDAIDESFASLDDLFLGIVGNFSIAAWIKIESLVNSHLSLYAYGQEEHILFDDDSGWIDINVFSNKIEGSIVEYDGLNSEWNSYTLQSDTNIVDNEWHHVVFSLSEDFYSLYLNGTLLKRERNNGYVGFVVDETFVYITLSENFDIEEGATASGELYVDDVAMFEVGLSIYEVQGLYEEGLEDFLEAMPVDSREKVTTTWGSLKKPFHRN